MTDYNLKIALTNKDIERISKNLVIKDFRGIFMKNQLPNKIFKNETGIINLDLSDGEGTHWIAYSKNNDKTYYFDSFGLDPPREIVKYLKYNLHISTFQIQPLDTNHCGHLCILFLKLLEKHSFEDVIMFLSQIHFGKMTELTRLL